MTATTFVMMLSIVNSVTKASRPPAPPEHIRSKEPPNSGLRPTPKRASPVSVLDLWLPTPAEINPPSPYPSSTRRHHRRWNRKSIAASASSTSPIGTPATDASDDRRASSTRHIVPTIDDSDAHFTIHGKDSDYDSDTWELDDNYAPTLMDILHDILDSEERGEESPPPAAPPPWPPPQVRPPDTLAPTWKNDAPGSPTSDYSIEETGIPSSAAPPATGTLSVQLDLQHSDAVDPPGLIRDATSSTLNKSSLAVNPRTLSSPARRASQDSSTPAIQLGLPPLLRPAIVLPRRPPGAPPHPSCQQPCCVLSPDGTAYCPPAAACPEPECGSWLVSNAVSVEVLYCCCCGSPILGSRPIFSCPDCSYDACVACSLPPKPSGNWRLTHHAIMLPGQSRYSAWPGHGLPSASEAMSPALTKRQRKRLLKKEKAIKHREDATRRQTERAREQKQKQKQTEKNIDADFQLDGKTLPGSGWATG